MSPGSGRTNNFSIERCSVPKLSLQIRYNFLGQPVYAPGGGLGIPTDRDQRSWVFLKDPRKYFVTDRKPQKIPSEKPNPKKYPPKTRFVFQKLSMI